MRAVTVTTLSASCKDLDTGPKSPGHRPALGKFLTHALLKLLLLPQLQFAEHLHYTVPCVGTERPAGEGTNVALAP